MGLSSLNSACAGDRINRTPSAKPVHPGTTRF
jgi:hypothetical protein